MADYYLISQLPSLDGLNDNTPLPITEEYFLELCNRFLNKKALGEVKKITLLPPMESEKKGNTLLDDWNKGERNLRLALAKIRAEKMGKSLDIKTENLPTELLKVATTATEIDNPLEAEYFLLQYRLQFLETLRPMNGFSEEFIFYYGLKLKLINRIRSFDLDIGKSAYKNIYNSILNGDRLEA